MDHGVVHAFSFSGRIDGVPELPHARYRFSVLADGALIGTAAGAAVKAASNQAIELRNGVAALDLFASSGDVVAASNQAIELRNGVAALDLFASSGDVVVYSARFRLIVRTASHGCRLVLDCRAQLASDRDLVGCWSDSSHRDQRFSLALLHHQRYKDTPATHVVSMPRAFALGAGRYVGRGEQRGSDGEVYPTEIDIELHEDGAVSGVSTEDKKHCRIQGTWCCDGISYGLEYPAREDNERLDFYSFRGHVSDAMTFTGQWQYVKRSQDEEDVEDTESQALVAGIYTFRGSDGSLSNSTEEEVELTVVIQDDGALEGLFRLDNGKSMTKLKFKGSWVKTSMEIRLSRLDSRKRRSTLTYRGVVDVVDDVSCFDGTWESTGQSHQSARRSGRFRYGLVSYEPLEAASTSSTPSPRSVQSRQRGTFVFAGRATSDTGEVFEIVLTLATSDTGEVFEIVLTLGVAVDGSLCGQCLQQATPPMRFELQGSWRDDTIKILLTYAGTSIEMYTYRGEIVDNTRFIGQWRHVSVRSKGERGRFEYRLEQAWPAASLSSVLNLPQMDELQPGEYELQGIATSDANHAYPSALALQLSSNGTLRGTSHELSGVGICGVAGEWTSRRVQYQLLYGATMTYTYIGSLKKNRLVGTWERVGGKNLPNECGHWEFAIQVGAVGEHESSDRGFTLSQAEYLEAAEDDTESSLGDNADEDGGFLPGMFVFDGAATSNAGITFNATWTLCLHRDGTLRGESVETSVSSLPQRCPLEGTWRRRSIDVMLRLSHRYSVTYRYVGELVGKRRLTGQWKQTASDSKYAAGIFAFDLRDGDAQERQSMEQDGASASEESSRTNLPGLAELRPGEMEFRGQATAMAGYVYKSTLRVRLADDGSLSGSSEEHAVRRVCDVKGKWTRKGIEYYLDYSGKHLPHNTYVYVGSLEGNTLGENDGDHESV
ncbi:hypothetical protein ATCC90586_001969 [Pythium insidiosum]|nr:hypothetical protein ATCC90586_001969 [Pythium insidiosum]